MAQSNKSKDSSKCDLIISILFLLHIFLIVNISKQFNSTEIWHFCDDVPLWNYSLTHSLIHSLFWNPRVAYMWTVHKVQQTKQCF